MNTFLKCIHVVLDFLMKHILMNEYCNMKVLQASFCGPCEIPTALAETRSELTEARRGGLIP